MRALAEGTLTLTCPWTPVQYLSAGVNTREAGEMLPALEECLEINWQFLKSPQDDKLCYTKKMALK